MLMVSSLSLYCLFCWCSVMYNVITIRIIFVLLFLCLILVLVEFIQYYDNGFIIISLLVEHYRFESFLKILYYLLVGKKNVSKTAVNGYHLLLKIFFLYNTSYYQILSHFYVICCPFQNQSRYSSVTVNCQPTYRVILRTISF